MKKTIIGLVLILLLGGCFKPSEPKNIILFIGDGMGASHVTAGKVQKGTLELERCPVGGMMTTWSADSLTTDSAASATAMATGIKTGNGMVSVDLDDKRLKTVLEIAEKKGKSTGLVSTCAVTHATPASFATHVSHRSMKYKIAKQLSESDVDVLFGGGLDHFSPSNGDSCLPQLKAQMAVATNEAMFRALGTPDRAAALLYGGHPPRASERTVSLREMTERAIEILDQNQKGFFLMVEGSQIDWAGHQKDVDYLAEEMVDFDDAIGAGLDFAKKNRETLIVITSDHECGGFCLYDGSLDDQKITQSSFSTNYHSATIVPLFATGPGSEALGGWIDNAELGKMLIKLVQ